MQHHIEPGLLRGSALQAGAIFSASNRNAMKPLARVLLALLPFTLAQQLQAQNPDTKRNWHWYFGNKAGLDFSSGVPAADTTGIMAVGQGCSTISDVDGNLLFYTDGKWAYDSQGDTMPNGFDLGVGFGATPFDGTVIIPKPGSDRYYYIFTVDGAEHGFQNGLRYHVVDMEANGGRGDVVQANVQLAPGVVMSEEIAATRHANGCDYWVIVHGWYAPDFLAFKVTADGVDPAPVSSLVGYDYGAAKLIDLFAGGFTMRMNPQGTKLAQGFDWLYANTGLMPELMLYEFDKGTGQFLDDWFGIPADTGNAAITWSPNGQILYQEDGYDFARLCQFDLSVFDSTQVAMSKTIIRSGPTNLEAANDMKIGPDGRIYSCTELAFFFGKDSLGIIENPDVMGPGCGYRLWAVGLNGRFPYQSLPNFVADFAAPEAPEHCVTAVNTQDIGGPWSVSWQEGWLVLRPSRAVQGSLLDVQVYDARSRLVRSYSRMVDGEEHRLPFSGHAPGVYVIAAGVAGHGAFHDKVIVH